MVQTISFRAEIDDYTSRVLGVVKEKFGLRDKSQALNLFARMYGADFVEKEIREEFVNEVLSIVQEHHKNHPKRKMNLKELNELTGL